MTENDTNRPQNLYFVLLVGAMFLLTLYPILRYGGLWGEIDTSHFSRVISATLDSGKLVPSTFYPNGYGYPVLVVFLTQLTGVGIPSWQIFGGTLLAVWMVWPAWLLYREFTGSSRGATLATLILLIQPEFLFPLLRGSHEKFTRGLMLLGLYILLRSLRSQERMSRFAGLVLAFYLVIYAIITFNNLFASSYILALAIALLLSRLMIALSPLDNRFTALNVTVRRLLYATAISLAIAFTFTFYAYQPAQQQFALLQSVWDKLGTLFLELSQRASTSADNPYIVVAGGWISLPIYLLVSLANWLLLAFSAPLWLWQSWQLLRGKQQFEKPYDLLLWAFYGTFTFLGVLSVAVDWSGAIEGNLQHRMFPSFAMLAAPFLAKWLIETSQLLDKPLMKNGLAFGIGLLALLSLFKATNEPLVSNKWLFYNHSEMQALEWAEDTLPESKIWAGYDERLSASITIRGTPRQLQLDQGNIKSDTPNILISDIIRARYRRLKSSWFVEADSTLTYDNGQAQLYHLRPRTPYQK